MYTSESDPVIQKHSNVFAWTRPLIDLSRVLLFYPHQHAMAIMCHATAAERESVCLSFPTPNDLSETYLPHRMNTTISVFGRSSEQSPTTSASQMALPVGNVQVVLALLILWNKDCALTLPGPVNSRLFQKWEKEWGSVKFLWQELHSRIKGHDLQAQDEMLKVWPKE